MIYRCSFLFVYADSHVWNEKQALWKAFFWGVRFDTKVITVLLLATLFLAIVELVLKRLRRNWGTAYTAVSTLLFVLTALMLTVDFFYYSFFQSHIDILVFGLIHDDTVEILRSMWTDFPIVKVLAGVAFLSFVSWKLFSWLFKRDFSRMIPMKAALFIPAMLVFITVYFYGLRGTFSTFPLQIDDSTISSNPFINQLTLNGIFTFENAIEQNKKNAIDGNPHNYLQRNNLNLRQLTADFLQTDIRNIDEKEPLRALMDTTPVNTFIAQNPPHVVVIQMEGMGAVYFSKHSGRLNLLGKLADICSEENCYVFENFMPAANITIPTLEHFVTQTPIAPVAQSPFYSVLFSTATALPFLQNNYQTSFISGARLGWRNINNYLPAQGFQSLEGWAFLLENNPQATDNDWGVFDEYMFDRIFEKLEKSAAPQYIFGMSVTNHSPYNLHSHYQPLPIEIDDSLQKIIRPTVETATVLKNFQTYQYACDMLGKFIQKVKDSPFAQNIIIIATGDHNIRQVFNFDDGQPYWTYSVPMIAYIPQQYLPSPPHYHLNTAQWAWHGDIFPTLYGLALSNTPYIKLGRDLLRDTTVPYAINDFNKIFTDAGAYDMTQNLYFRWEESHYLSPAADLAANPELQKACKSARALYHLQVYLEHENASKLNNKIP
ncbi:MAG: LTA synthase family protein [Prevotellaceae bacterium]|nr:LTA synthase family protein [Prevotellaceae bacterium]